MTIENNATDGQVSREELAKTVSQDKDLVEISGELIALANEHGGPDNITVIIARFSGDSLQDLGGGESVGHEVYPLLDADSTTEPVPLSKDSSPPTLPRSSMIAAGTAAALIVAGALFLAIL